ncbi:MAG: transglycosylase SLT domain-containing protein [Clostridiales bacterium]|nr:transglycosylase SLT domain-containing protein [Clostridiales bacterium]
MTKKYIATLITALAMPVIACGQSILSLSQSLTDETVVLPESFETDTHQMMQNWYLQNYTELDPGIEYSQDIPTTDAVIIDRLSKMPVDIEMPFNSIVRSIINAYTQRRRPLVQNMLGMGNYYNPIFEEALEKEGMPLELKYLPVIESALNPNAVSRAGAAGLWQFMTPTAKGLGLEVSTIVDERRDPVKSSQMAARYLKELYTIYGDWSLAIAAYNCGPGNVNKAMRRAGDKAKDFWAIYPFLPAETRGYVPAFIAANYVMTYYKEHGIKPAVARRPIVTDSVHVKKRVYFQQIADVLKIPVEEIRILNPQYRKDYIPGDIKPYPLVLPSFQIYSYIMSEDSIIAHDAAKYSRRTRVEPSSGTTVTREDGDYIITETTKYHKVKRGDTFNSIARTYGVTVASIKKTNKIKSLKRGRTLKIVITERTPKPKEEIDPTEHNNLTVDSLPASLDADSLNAIIPDSILATLNGEETDSTMLEAMRAATMDAASRETLEKAGADGQQDLEETKQHEEARKPEQQVTKKEPAKKSTQAANQPVYHKVRSGESIAKIAKRYGTTTAKVLKLNNMTARTKIYPGDKIRVK